MSGRVVGRERKVGAVNGAGPLWMLRRLHSKVVSDERFGKWVCSIFFLFLCFFFFFFFKKRKRRKKKGHVRRRGRAGDGARHGIARAFADVRDFIAARKHAVVWLAAEVLDEADLQGGGRRRHEGFWA